MAKLTEYTAVTTLDQDDILITDGTGGTKKITAKNLANTLTGMSDDVTELSEDFSKVIEKTENIYDGVLPITSNTTGLVNVLNSTIPAGTYKVLINLTTNKPDSGGTFRFSSSATVVASSYVLATVVCENNTDTVQTITLSSDALSAWAFAGSNSSGSEGYVVKLNKLFITSDLTYDFSNYTPDITAVDFVAREEIDDVKNIVNNSVKKWNAYDVLPEFATYENRVTHGNTFAWSNGQCTITGTNDGTIAFSRLYNNTSVLPSALEVGKSYYLKLKWSAESAAQIRFYFYNSGGTYTGDITTREDMKITVPENTVGLIMRVEVPINTPQINVVLQEIALLTTESNEVLTEALTEEVDALWITNSKETLHDINIIRTDFNKATLYGTENTSSGIRLFNFFNDCYNSYNSSTDPSVKTFPAGTYRFEFTSSGTAAIGSDTIYFGRASGPTSSAFKQLSNHETFMATEPFVIIMRTPYATNFGTEQAPTYLEIHLYKTDIGEGATLYPTGDTTDRADEIRLTLSTHRVCKLSEGDFYVSGIYMPKETALIGSGVGTRIILLDSTTTGAAVKMADHCEVKNVNIVGSTTDITFTQGSIDELHLGTRHGILWLGEATGGTSTSADNTHFCGVVSGCRFSGFTGGAITCESTGYRHHSGINADNCQIQNCGAGINISRWSEYNRFTTINVNDCYYGAINNGGNNSFVNCGFTANEVNFWMDSGENKSVLYDGTTGSTRNDGHGQAIGCIFNHAGLFTANAGYSIIARSVGSGFVFSGGNMFYGKVLMQACTSFLFDAFNFGSGVEIDCYSTISYLFTNCYFRSNAKLIPYDNSTGEIITTFNADGNLDRIKLVNCFNSILEPVTAQVLASTT